MYNLHITVALALLLWSPIVGLADEVRVASQVNRFFGHKTLLTFTRPTCRLITFVVQKCRSLNVLLF